VKARFGEIGILLQRVLELDDRGAELVGLNVSEGALEVFFRAPAAAHQGQDNEQRYDECAHASPEAHVEPDWLV
jgi:hypothetical protein